VVWVVVGIAIVIALGLAIWVQQQHSDRVVEILQPLCGQRLEMAIVPVLSRSAPAAIGRYVGVIAAVEPSTRWVTFDWIELSDDEQSTVATTPPDRLANGVVADCIRWVEPMNGSRIDLT
jgi:hypothetical protein